MSAHTPGPWHYSRLDEWTHSVVTKHGKLLDGSDNCWAIASVNKNREPEHEANARLISAAPDLLSAVRGLLDALPSATTHPAIKAARAAIAKATGERP